MKLYIAGPMTGLPDNNYPAFHEAARDLRARGYEVANPAEHVIQCDAVAVLPNWQTSRGATIKVNLALQLGMGIYPVVDDGVAA